MNEEIEILKKRSDAYYTYLDFCSETGEIPRKEVFNQIKNCEDTRALYRIRKWIEDNQVKFARMSQQAPQSEKKSFWSRLFKF
ncbi:hypothetical protein [Chryseobacterium sp.]|uniref:hypothetical protein n=1 Tax=Chryseobacterium sp. TaxID=1871047 RepID=UPI0028A1C6D3|nr:hypothetical protein [Chryseobacterium sp.]